MEPWGFIQGCSKYCRQSYEARGGPGELNTYTATVAVAVAVFYIETGQCLGQIFGTNSGQIAVVEPLAGIQGCPRHCRQCYEARAGPGELKSSPATVAFAVAVSLH